MAFHDSSARAEICFPPLLGDRPRLHEMGEARVLWLDLLFREHEVCWRDPVSPDEKRIFALGNSTIYGFPLPYERTAIGLVNRFFDRQGVSAHVFNLGFVFTYQVKEAMILSKALAYAPDLILYGVTLDDLVHVAPIDYPPLVKFFDSNSLLIEELAARPPASFREPFARYRAAQSEKIRPYAAWIGLRQAGTFLRVTARETAMALRKRMFPGITERRPRIQKADPQYDCDRVTRAFEKKYENWETWSMLEALSELRRKTGVEVLVVNWPVAHEPRGDCYNARYPAVAFTKYVDWMQQTADALSLPYLDLHALLTPGEFVDSLHPTARGQRKVAVRLASKLGRMLDEGQAR